MVGLCIAVVVIIWAGYMIGKKNYATAVLLVAGIIMLAASGLLGIANLLPEKQASGSFLIDLFDVVRRSYSTTVAALGLTIMSIAGFSKLMDHIKASDVLLDIMSKPLHRIENPYILLMSSFWIVQFLSIFIPSAAGLSVLLMVSLYPLLIRKGVSPLSALAIIGTARTLTIGPASPNMIFGSGILNMEVSTYFLQYQLPMLGPMILILFAAEFFTQRYWDKKAGVSAADAHATLANIQAHDTSNLPPKIYALLPLFPLALIIALSPIVTDYFGLPKVKLNVATAMFLSAFIAIIVDMLHKRSVSKSLANLKPFFEQMGKTFGLVIAIIAASSVFAKGIINLGAISTMVEAAQNAGFGVEPLTICACLIVFFSAFLMGSGNAAFFAFAALVPDVAAKFMVPGILIMMPIDFMSCFGRTMSPVFGATMATCGMAGQSPFELAKRQAIPCLILMVVCPFLAFWLF